MANLQVLKQLADQNSPRQGCAAGANCKDVNSRKSGWRSRSASAVSSAQFAYPLPGGVGSKNSADMHLQSALQVVTRLVFRSQTLEFADFDSDAGRFFLIQHPV